MGPSVGWVGLLGGSWDQWETRHHWDHRGVMGSMGDMSRLGSSWGHGINGRHVTIGIISGVTGSMGDITIGIISGVMGSMGDTSTLGTPGGHGINGRQVTIGIIGGVMGWMGDMTPLGSLVGSWDQWETRHHWDHWCGHRMDE